MRRHRPRVVGGLNYLLGWSGAVLRGAPRAQDDVVAYVRRDELRRIRRRALRVLGLTQAPARPAEET
jgi:hypothetical protein